LQDGHILVRHVYFTINPLETRSPFWWKIRNASYSSQQYPNLGESKHVMPNEFEMIKLVRANHVTQAIVFRIILKVFRKIACGYSSSNQFSHDVDANGKPMGFFDSLDLVALNAKETGRMAQNAHGLICSRFSRLYNIIELLDKGYELVMDWMGCVASIVMGPRLVSLSDNNSSLLNRMPNKV